MEESFKASSGRSTATALVKCTPISPSSSRPQQTNSSDLVYIGLSGPMSNIEQGRFAAAPFHSRADTLKWDGHTGDYDPNLSSHSMGIRMYPVIEHPDL